MAVPISAGKLRKLMTLADENGRFKMMAIDQRLSLQKMLAEVTGRKLDEVSFEEIVATKQLITGALAPYASAVLTDPIYGYANSVPLIPGTVGLLLAYEDAVFETGGPTTGKERKSRLIEGWSVEKACRAGAQAIKLLLYYHPDAGTETNQHQKALARRVGDECARHDVPYLLELVAYPIEEESADTPAFARRKPDLVTRSAAEFSRPEYGVDLLKLEFPANLKYCYEFCRRTFDAKEREPVYDLGQVRGFCEQLDGASTVPWVILSAGVGIDEFLVSLQLAVESEASGFLCGRAIWQEAVARFPDQEAMEEYLAEAAAINFLRANAAAEAALPWFEHRRFRGIENVVVADASRRWYQDYGS